MTENTAARIEGAKKNIDKITKKLERVQVALGGGKNPYFYIESDLGRTERELADAAAALAKWEAKGAKEDAEERELKIPAIEAFLETWKQKAAIYYKAALASLLDYLADRKTKTKALIDDCKANGLPASGATFTAKEKSLGLDYSSSQRHIKASFPALAVELRAYGKGWEERLETLLEREKNAKRQGLIVRVREIVGEVTDAAGLYVADDGEINGVVVGTQGKARVTTISAGGYNVQCFHFRVLVKAL